MPIITPDLSEVQGMEALPAGSYAGEIKAIEVKTSKAGNPMIEGVADLQADGQRRTRKFWCTLTGKGAYGFEALLRACHFDAAADEFKKGSGSFDTDQLVGQSLIFVVEQDEYNGQINDKIKTFLKA